MAFRTVVRRWPTASSQVRALMRTSQGQQQQQTRAYAEEYTGDSLQEKEKAAENRYIRQMEAERRRKKEAAGEANVPGEVPIPSATAETAAKTQSRFPTGAVVAGVALAVGAYWLVFGTSDKEEKKEEA